MMLSVSIRLDGGHLLRAVIVAASVVTSACAFAAAPAATPATPGQIDLMHELGADKGTELAALVERFNATSKDFRIVVREGAGLPAERSPGLMILGPEDQERLLSSTTPRYKPLYRVMAAARMPLKTLRPPSIMTRSPIDSRGRLLALPVALSTPVLFFNRDVFQRAGLDGERLPLTWIGMQAAIGRLVDAGNRCPYTVSDPARVMIENTSAWHNEPTSVRRGKREALSINGMLQIKHVALMASWYRASYLRIFDSAAAAQQRFASGECAVIAAPSSEGPEFRKHAAFPVGVAPLPYHDDYPGAPQNTLASGASLWVGNGLSAAEYKAIARFVRFWLEPENQIAWQRTAGYLPLNIAGLFAVRESEVLTDELENVRVAVGQLANKPATDSSAASPTIEREQVRRVVDEELQAVWDDRKSAKEALDTAVARVEKGGE
jgi:sn-glycerol 3-phosphate transport system substrate-binding protein